MISYLYKRGQRYYYRQRVPAGLVRHLKQKYLYVSLRTSRYGEAKRRVRVLQAQTEQLFTTISLNMLSESEIQQIIKKYKDTILDGLYQHRERGNSHVNVLRSRSPWDMTEDFDTDWFESPHACDIFMEKVIALMPFVAAPNLEAHTAVLKFTIAHYQRMVAAYKSSLSTGHLDEVTREKTDHLIKDNNLAVNIPAMNEKPTADYNRLARALLRAQIDVCQVEIERLQGEDPEYDRLRREELAKPNKLLSELCADILTEQQASTKRTSWMKVNQHHQALLRVMEDKPLRNYTERDIRTAAETVKKWPKKAATTKGLDGIPAADIVKRTDLGEPISYNMIKARLTQLCSTFKRALELDLIDRNPCPPLSKLLPVGKQQRIDDKGELIDGDRHLPWSNQELLSLLGTSYFSKAVHRVRAPENFWLPVLAILTGCRLNELAQLYCDDLLQSEDGLWLMRITRDAKRKQDTKNDNSVRRVPIHRQLIGLGLLRYRDWIESQGHERLFPNLPYFPTVENFSNGFSKRIGHHFKRHVSWGDPNQPKTFHGLRSTFIQTLRDRNGVHEEHIRYLVGHAAQHKMTAHYGGAKPVSVLDKHLQSLDYGIDFVRLLGRWEPPKK